MSCAVTSDSHDHETGIGSGVAGDSPETTSTSLPGLYIDAQPVTPFCLPGCRVPTHSAESTLSASDTSDSGKTTGLAVFLVQLLCRFLS